TRRPACCSRRSRGRSGTPPSSRSAASSCSAIARPSSATPRPARARSSPVRASASDPLSSLASWLQATCPPRERPWVVGLVGLPGSGKSTLAGRLLRALDITRSLTLSLDDFYLEPEPRRAAGFELRGPPGTHDLELLRRFLIDLDARRAPLEVPVFDREH